MDLAWFIYTIAIMLVAIVAASTSVTMWVLTSRKDFLVSASAFVLYVFEVALIFYGEYRGDKPYLTGYMQTGLVTPVPTLIVSALLVMTVWVWMIRRVHAPLHKRRVIVLTIVFGAASALLAPVEGNAGTLRTYIYWALRDLVLIGSLGFAYWYYRNKATENEKHDIERDRGFFRVLAILAGCMFLEDTVNILLIHPQASSGIVYEFFWHLTERNLSENVAMVYCAVHLFKADREFMRVFSRHPAENVQGTTEEADRDERVDLKLPRFCDEHGMSDREREVMALLLKGKTTNEIAQELYISQGTVKAHLHRIYTKAGVANRKDLAAEFWRS